MSEDQHSAGRVALEKALAQAGKYASTAAVAASLVPLSMVALSHRAEAVPASLVGLSSAQVSGTDGNGTATYTYTLDYLGGGAGTTLTQIEIPELVAGAFVLQTASGGSTPGLPLGWTEAQYATSQLNSPTLKSSGSVAAYLDISFSSGSFLASGSTFSFTLYADTTTSVAANMDVQTLSDGAFVIDPPTPAPAPEPASMAVLGTALTGLAALRRRKKR